MVFAWDVAHEGKLQRLCAGHESKERPSGEAGAAWLATDVYISASHQPHLGANWP